MAPEPLTKNQRLALASNAFSPAAPVNDAMLFAHRDDQVDQCIQTLFQRGQHIALYGERGVGKTSLAIMLPSLVRNAKVPTLDAVRVDCNTADTFRSVWRKVFREMRQPLDEAVLENLEPEDVRYELQQLDRRMLIVIDELDRMEDDQGLSLLADTLKTLSDHSVESTIMLVGVADSLVALVGEHVSIVRSLVQVHMPRMSGTESASIIDKGMTRAQLGIESEAKQKIILLAEGLAHYVHLLALQAALRAVADDRQTVTDSDVGSSMEKAVDTHSITDEYQKATRSPQPGHLFEEVLLACAFASRDDLGYFRPADVRLPLSRLVGREMGIANFQRHLAELSGEKRGNTLHRDGEARNYRFRFRNPLLQPYTKIRALAKGKITEEQRRELEALRDPGRRGVPFDPEAGEGGQQQLFGRFPPADPE